jgi:hypothetical protein
VKQFDRPSGVWIDEATVITSASTNRRKIGPGFQGRQRNTGTGSAAFIEGPSPSAEGVAARRQHLYWLHQRYEPQGFMKKESRSPDRAGGLGIQPVLRRIVPVAVQRTAQRAGSSASATAAHRGRAP